jgi:hypothetical protein
MDDDRSTALHGLLQLGKDGIDGIGGHDIRFICGRDQKALIERRDAQVIAAAGRAYYIRRVLTRNMTMHILVSFAELY